MNPYLVRLKENGLKVTSQREAVLALFAKDNSRKTPYAVHKKLKKRLPQLGLPTVYRVLEELKEIGLLVQIPSEDRQLHYSLCNLPADKHHHHFVCRKCKKVEEVEHCNFKGISNFILRKLGAIVESHSLQLEGLCASCK
ncbi:MAG: Fur family transcriptional regulator [Candidatus Omnitrophota bacterium]